MQPPASIPPRRDQSLQGADSLIYGLGCTSVPPQIIGHGGVRVGAPSGMDLATRIGNVVAVFAHSCKTDL